MSFTYRPPEDLETALNAYCEQMGTTKTGTLNIALKAWLNTASSSSFYGSVTNANAAFTTVQWNATALPPSLPDG